MGGVPRRGAFDEEAARRRNRRRQLDGGAARRGGLLELRGLEGRADQLHQVARRRARARHTRQRGRARLG